jgi:hypothetical protein
MGKSENVSLVHKILQQNLPTLGMKVPDGQSINKEGFLLMLKNNLHKFSYKIRKCGRHSKKKKKSGN